MSKTTLGLHRKNLKQLSAQLRRSLAASSNEITEEAQSIMRRIRLVLERIRGLISRRELSRILGAAAVFFGLGFGTSLSAQNFNAPVADPFGVVKNNYVNIPTTVDIDGDGDLDLIIGGMNLYGYSTSPIIEFHENTGTNLVPQFAAPVQDTFGIDVTPLASYVVVPTFGDLDGDGDFDMIGGGSPYGLFYFENVGTAQAPSFAAPVANPFGLDDSIVYYSSPILLDLDDDGDLDILSGEYDGQLVYLENTGTATAPAFAPKQYNPFGLQASYYAFPSAGDVDWDGDLDIIVGDYYGDMHYFENTGTKTAPQFAAPVSNPSGIVSAGYISFPVLADFDGDTDPDLLVGEGVYWYGVSMNYYENLATGLSEAEFEAGLEVFPTLVEDAVELKSETPLDHIKLINTDGKLLREWSGEHTQLFMEDLSPGTYILELRAKAGWSTSRSIVKN